MSESGWVDLLQRVRADHETFLSDFLGELETFEAYEDVAVPQADIERTAQLAFELFLERLAAPIGHVGSAEFPETIGRRRARQGMRIDQFSEGVRVNFRLLWRALHRAAQPDLIDGLAANGERVLNMVERYAIEAQGAFLEETHIMAQLHCTARERALSKLFADKADYEQLQSAADVLSLPVDGVFELVAVDKSHVSEADRATYASDGGYAYEGQELVYWFRRRTGPVDWSLSKLETSGAYISRVQGLGALSPAARLAREMVEVSDEPRVLTLRDSFASLLRHELFGRFAGFEAELLGAWNETPGYEQSRYVETLDAFMRTGSIKEAGDALFLHRNTVFKRLRSFHELTGIDVTVPRDAVIAMVLISNEPQGANEH
ncbi:PucR family transcriptional regulator [Gulosibacter sediminis]|uniref:PucR family transcriptional regulator n=1 Tax=Gulosibacter sediminis TaxID=1729695 RepID=UPI0024AD7A3F|nr:PucR family transcriptional regulator [Gulosibacter sediminis]